MNIIYASIVYTSHTSHTCQTIGPHLWNWRLLLCLSLQLCLLLACLYRSYDFCKWILTRKLHKTSGLYTSFLRGQLHVSRSFLIHVSSSCSQCLCILVFLPSPVFLFYRSLFVRAAIYSTFPCDDVFQIL